MKFLIIVFLYIFSWIGFSTTFIPLSIEQQLSEAYGVIYGKFLDMEYTKLDDGREHIMTKAYFHIYKKAGFESKDIINTNRYPILYPGGKWQGITQVVVGAPTFKEEEEVILIVYKGRYGISIANLGLGKYNIIKERDDLFLSSSLFPVHHKLGKISFEYFNSLVLDRFGEKMHDVGHRVTLGNIKDRGREIASIVYRNPSNDTKIIEKNNLRESNSWIIWFLLIFSFLGIVSFAISKND